MSAIAKRLQQWRDTRSQRKEEKRHRKEALNAFAKVPLVSADKKNVTTLEESRQISYRLNRKELKYSMNSGDMREASATIIDIGELAARDPAIAEDWQNKMTPEHKSLIRREILKYSIPRFLRHPFKRAAEFLSTIHKDWPMRIANSYLWLLSLTSIPSWLEANSRMKQAYSAPSEENIRKAGIQNMVAAFDTITLALLTYFAYDFVRDLNQDIFALKAAGLLTARLVAHKAALALFAKSFAVVSVDAFKTSEQKHVEGQLSGIKAVELSLAALGAKDEYTRGHTERVAEYSEWIARDLGLTEREVQIVKHAAKLHDIGKLGLPDAILQKQGPLTDEEFKVVKKHPLRGYTIVAEMTDMDPLLLGILHHHEKLNGKGYYGLKGDDIHITARILSVADIFDALVTDRSYQKGRSTEQALVKLREIAAGGEIDGEVVEVFATAYAKREGVSLEGF